MIRPSRIRTLLTALVLGSAIAVPGLQLTQAVSPQITHAAPLSQAGPVLGGGWVNYATGARFSSLQLTAVGNGGVNGGLPVTYTYGLYVFDVKANRFVAESIAAPVPYATAGTAVFPLTALPTPSRVFFTTITLSLVSDSTIKVAISDYSRVFGHHYSTEFMYRPYAAPR